MDPHHALVLMACIVVVYENATVVFSGNCALVAVAALVVSSAPRIILFLFLLGGLFLSHILHDWVSVLERRGRNAMKRAYFGKS